MPFLRGREPRLVPSSPRLRHAQLQPHRLKGCPEAGDSNLNPFALLPVVPDLSLREEDSFLGGFIVPSV